MSFMWDRVSKYLIYIYNSVPNRVGQSGTLGTLILVLVLVLELLSHRSGTVLCNKINELCALSQTVPNRVGHYNVIKTKT